MNKQEYESVKRQFERARDEAVAAAEAEYDEALTALDRVWELSGGTRRVGRPRGTKKKRGGGRVGRPRGKATTRKKRGRKKKKTTRRKTTATGGRKKTRKRSKRGSLIEAMRDAVGQQRGKFTISDVKDTLAETKPGVLSGKSAAVFSSTMKRLEELGEINIVERGRGRRASIYKKA